LLDNRTEERGSSRQIKKVIAVSGVFLIEFIEGSFQLRVNVLVVELSGDVVKAAVEPLPDVGINFASGGDKTVTGTMLIDDLSVRLSVPTITDFGFQPDGFSLTWDSMPNKTYAVEFADTLGSPTVWTPLATGLASGGFSTSYLDIAPQAGTGFYRVVQE